MQNKIVVPLIASVVLIAAGCSNLERSRSLANPQVSASTIAHQVCSSCHGMDGNSESPNFPALAAQQKDYLVGQLKGFRAQHRSDPAGFEYMWGLSRKLTDAQVDGLASYYSAQTRTQPREKSDQALVDEGREIFTKGVPANNTPPCASCHGDKGQGNGTFPRLAYQHADYVYKQLMVFQRTDERPEGSIMKTVAHGLSPQNMKAVAAFVQEFSQQ